MKITMLGTGNANVTECYNTCFIMDENEKYFLVDCGGGNRIMTQLKRAGVGLAEIHDIFITHKHLDHMYGAVWVMNGICQLMHQGRYEGEAHIYAHDEVIPLLYWLSENLMHGKFSRFIGDRFHFVTLNDGDVHNIIGHDVTFFDILSNKDKQYGFCMDLGNGDKLTCLGDEPYRECELPYVQDAAWLMHEAFCLHSQADKFHPYEKFHSTVKDACEISEQLNVKNLILYHTEEVNLESRKELYIQEGCMYYAGNLYVPEDLETIQL